MSTQHTHPADLGLALRVFADPSGSNPVWSEIFSRLSAALWRITSGSPSIEDRRDDLGDAQELAFLTLRNLAFTDLIHVYREGLERWTVKRVRRATLRRRDERKCSFFGISWEHSYVPGKKLAKLVGDGHTVAEASRILREDPATRFALSEADAEVSYAAYRASTLPIRTEDDDEGVAFPIQAPSAESVYEESDQGLAQRLRDSFGDALDEHDIALLVAYAQGDPVDKKTTKNEIERARRRIKRVAPAREDVLAAILGTRTAVAA